MHLPAFFYHLLKSIPECAFHRILLLTTVKFMPCPSEGLSPAGTGPACECRDGKWESVGRCNTPGHRGFLC